MTVPGTSQAELQSGGRAFAPPVRTPSTDPGAVPEPRRRELAENARQLLATSFVAAYVGCLLVEPAANGPHPDTQLWTVPIDLASVAMLIACAVTLWRGKRRAAVLTVLAGAGLAAETVICPLSGHHLVGWYTWVQTALAAYVLLAGTALMARDRATPRRQGR